MDGIQRAVTILRANNCIAFRRQQPGQKFAIRLHVIGDENGAFGQSRVGHAFLLGADTRGRRAMVEPPDGPNAINYLFYYPSRYSRIFREGKLPMSTHPPKSCMWLQLKCTA